MAGPTHCNTPDVEFRLPPTSTVFKKTLKYLSFFRKQAS